MNEIPAKGLVDRVYSWLEIKAVDDEAWTFKGIATTISTDRGEDVVDPEGAVFKLPITMMWQHGKGDIKDAVGWITGAKVSSKIITVDGQMAKPKPDYPQPLRDALTGAWVMVRDKVVRGLSIGFNPLEWEPIKGTFGTYYKRWEFLELSPVNIPMNADATILTVKQYDSQTRAALGLTRKGVALLGQSPGASGTIAAANRGAVKLIPR